MELGVAFWSVKTFGRNAIVRIKTVFREARVSLVDVPAHVKYDRQNGTLGRHQNPDKCCEGEVYTIYTW